MKTITNKKFSLKLKVTMLLLLVCLWGNTLQAFAYTPEKTITSSVTLKYTLKNLLPLGVIQAFYVDSGDLYVTQHSSDDANTIISRCKIQGNEAIYQDSMTILGGGHGGTLEYCKYNNKNYFFITCNKQNGYQSEIARIQYTAGQTASYTSFPRVTNLKYANKSGSNLGDIIRVHGAYTTSNKLVLRVESKDTGNKSVTYGYFDGTKINQLLDKGNVNIKNYKSACTGSFTQTGSSIVRPYGSYQGMHSRYNCCVYVAGDKHSVSGTDPKIVKMSTSGKPLIEVTLKLPDYTEIEGLSRKNNAIYFAAYTKDSTGGKRNGQKIYAVDLDCSTEF